MCTDASVPLRDEVPSKIHHDNYDYIYSLDSRIIYSRTAGLYILGMGLVKREFSKLHFQNVRSLSSGVLTQPAPGRFLNMKIA